MAGKYGVTWRKRKENCTHWQERGMIIDSSWFSGSTPEEEGSYVLINCLIAFPEMLEMNWFGSKTALCLGWKFKKK